MPPLPRIYSNRPPLYSLSEEELVRDIPNAYLNISIIADLPLPLIPIKEFNSGEKLIVTPSSLPPLNAIDLIYWFLISTFLNETRLQ